MYKTIDGTTYESKEDAKKHEVLLLDTVVHKFIGEFINSRVHEKSFELRELVTEMHQILTEGKYHNL